MYNLRTFSILWMSGDYVYQKSRKNIWKKFGGKEKMSTFAIPNEKRAHRRLSLAREVHWKDWGKVQEASTEKNTIYREALILLKELRSVSDKLRVILLYNEEFDPGSGWTLAAGLTHASRGAAWDGDSSKSWWRPAQGCVTREQLARFRGITGGNAD